MNTSINALLVSPQTKTPTSKAVLKTCMDKLTDPHTEYEIIFLYFGAVTIVNDADYFEDWQALKEKYKVRLVACSTVAKRRSVNEDNIGPFELTGLSEFYSVLHRCNTLVQI